MRGSLQSPRNAGRTVDEARRSITFTFNPRATRGALNSLIGHKFSHPSIPAQRGAHVGRMAIAEASDLQSPRNAGRTSHSASMTSPIPFNPRATRGAPGCPHEIPARFPSIPAQRGAHINSLKMGSAVILQSPRNAGSTGKEESGERVRNFNPRATQGARCLRVPILPAQPSIPAQRGARTVILSPIMGHMSVNPRATRAHAVWNCNANWACLQSPRNAGRTGRMSQSG